MNQTLYINVSTQQLVAGPLSNSAASVASQFIGSHVALDLVFLADNGDGTLSVLGWNAYAAQIGVFAPMAKSFQGFFPLTFGDDTTPPIPAGAFARRIEAELNVLASIIAAGGITLSGQVGGPFAVFFNEPGARDLIGSSNDQLFPGAQVTVDRAQEGTETQAEIQIIRFAALAAAFNDSWTNFASDHNPNAVNGKSGVLSLATAACRQIVGNSGSGPATLEVRVTPPGGQPMTVLSAPFTLINSQLADDSTAPVDLAEVPTRSEVNAAIADAVSGTAANPSSVEALTLTPGTTYTASDLTAIISKLNALIAALTR